MIVIDVACAEDHRFEGWFPNAEAFARQRDEGRISCPYCGSVAVERAPTAARIGGVRANRAPSRQEVVTALAGLQRRMLEDSTWVGRDFASKARAMAEGEAPAATIHGQATVAEAKSLHEDGVAVMPLLFPVVPPEEQN